MLGCIVNIELDSDAIMFVEEQCFFQTVSELYYYALMAFVVEPSELELSLKAHFLLFKTTCKRGFKCEIDTK